MDILIVVTWKSQPLILWLYSLNISKFFFQSHGVQNNKVWLYIQCCSVNQCNLYQRLWLHKISPWSPQTHIVYIQYIYCVQTVHLLYSYIRVPFLPSSCWWHERCPSFLGPWPHKEYPGEGEGAPQRSCLPHQVYLASWVCAHLPKHPDLWVQLSHWPKSRIKTYLNKEWLQKVILLTLTCACISERHSYIFASC